MSKVLDAAALLAAAYEARLPTFNGHRARLEAMMEALAFDLARHLRLELDRGAEFDIAKCTLTAQLGPSHPKQPCPPMIARWDAEGPWVVKPRKDPPV